MDRTTELPLPVWNLKTKNAVFIRDLVQDVQDYYNNPKDGVTSTQVAKYIEKIHPEKSHVCASGYLGKLFVMGWLDRKKLETSERIYYYKHLEHRILEHAVHVKRWSYEMNHHSPEQAKGVVGAINVSPGIPEDMKEQESSVQEKIIPFSTLSSASGIRALVNENKDFYKVLYQLSLNLHTIGIVKEVAPYREEYE